MSEGEQDDKAEFVPGEMVWLAKYSINVPISEQKPVLVMCLEEDFPLQTFLHGTEVITIMSTRAFSFSSTDRQNKLFKTEEACKDWIAKINRHISEQRAEALMRMLRAKVDRVSICSSKTEK